MARTHARSPSPGPDASGSLLKRLKTSHLVDPTPNFAAGVLEASSVAKLNASYTTSEPFKYAIVDKLFQEDLLQKAKDECLNELSFTQKETDIYKVNQTGDLASLSFLSPEQIALLPSLLTLRDALYSHAFRNFLRSVTGCGPLSGSKQDMSVNTYTAGCHLLNHDDVIGSRRVSYILYMPLPSHQPWEKEWGGALELYSVKEGESGRLEPECVPVKSIPPSWNQFVFFEVQPGRSFHSVEEVVIGAGKGEGDGSQRLSISGWFHKPQEGEEGYEQEPDVTEKSSREQLTTTSTVFTSYPDSDSPPLPDSPLSQAHLSFLSKFFNPVYLQTNTMNALAARFVEESSVELHSFLNDPLANQLCNGLRELDIEDGLGPSRSGRIPPHSSGTQGPWMIKGPPHKWRYCTLLPQSTSKLSNRSSDEIMRNLQDELFPSEAFRAWLACVSRLLPLRYSVEARRFRPGLDYTLATSEEKEARLDVCLGLTPEVEGVQDAANAKGKESESESVPKGWVAGEWGGWECYMAPHDEEDDPAVYRSGSSKKAVKDTTNGPEKTDLRKDEHIDADAPEADDDDADTNDEDDDDGTLLTVQPGFNRLLLVLRDEGVMQFVKYVSAAAQGSRWDVCGEYEVGMVQEDSDEDT